MPYIRRGTKEFTTVNWALFLGAFVIFSSLYAVQPLLPVFTSDFNVHPAVSSLSLSFSTFGMAFGLLVAGSLSEWWGRKPMMVLSLISVSALTILSSFSPNFALFLILRALEGAALAGLPATAMAYLGEEIDPNHLSTVMGLYISGNSIGGLAGRIIAGTIAPVASWHLALFVIGAAGVAVSLWFALKLPPSQNFTAQPLQLTHLTLSLTEHLKNRVLVLLFSLGFLLMAGFVTLYNYISFELAAAPYRVPEHMISWIFLLYLVGTFSSTWMGGLADKYGRTRVLWTGISLMMIGVLITLSQPLFLKIVGIGIMTFGFFGSHSILSSWVGRTAHSHKAQASALYLFFYYIGSSVGGTIGGFLWGSYGWTGVVLLISAFILLAFLASAALVFVLDS